MVLHINEFNYDVYNIREIQPHYNQSSKNELYSSFAFLSDDDLHVLRALKIPTELSVSMLLIQSCCTCASSYRGPR